jgi:hypothetical protein
MLPGHHKQQTSLVPLLKDMPIDDQDIEIPMKNVGLARYLITDDIIEGPELFTYAMKKPKKYKGAGQESAARQKII